MASVISLISCEGSKRHGVLVETFATNLHTSEISVNCTIPVMLIKIIVIYFTRVFL